MTMILGPIVPVDAGSDDPSGGIVEYPGMCNASAAAAIGDGRFIVADDEDKPETVLRVYRNGRPGAPLELPLSSSALELEEDHREMDLEGAARIGDRIYWIGSHSASAEGKARHNRRRLFATKVDLAATPPRADVVGQPYKDLIGDLDEDPRYKDFHLKDAAKLASKKAGGLSIEGLAATPDDDLLIGFRNPIPGGKALIARLKNPNGVTEGKPAKFGPPIQLDLGGLGIRSMEWAPALRSYLIVGGLPGPGEGSRLFRWSGSDEEATAIPSVGFCGLNPEAIFLEGSVATVLSDDGGRLLGGKERDCSAAGAAKSFRGFQVSLERP